MMSSLETAVSRPRQLWRRRRWFPPFAKSAKGWATILEASVRVFAFEFVKHFIDRTARAFASFS